MIQSRLLSRRLLLSDADAKGYGATAAVILEACSTSTLIPELSTVIAYYSAELPKSTANYLQSLDILLHTVGTQKITLRRKSYLYPYAIAEIGCKTYDEASASLV